MSTEPKQDEHEVAERKHEHAEPKRENPAEQFEKARTKAVEGSESMTVGAGIAAGDLDRRLDLGDGGIFSDERAAAERFDRVAPAPSIAPSPLHGSYAGELVRRIRAALEEFEQHVANDARAAAGEAHDLIVDAVNELRGHFHRE